MPLPHGVAGVVYGYRAYGPFDVTYGLRYNGAKLLLDPYARSLAGKFTWDDALLGSVRSADSSLPDYDETATELFLERMLALLERVGP